MRAGVGEVVVKKARIPAQAKRYRDSLSSRPGWDFAVETAVVEVYGDFGYRWFPVG